MNKPILLFLLIFAAPIGAHAHGRWMVPSHTVVSGSEPTSVAVEMSISNDVFHADNPYGGMPLENLGKAIKPFKAPPQEHPLAKVARSTQLVAYYPDGSQSNDHKIVNLGRKSASSVPLKHNGTYRLEINQDPIFFTSYETSDHNHGRVFGIDERARSQVPKDAKQVAGVKLTNRVQTFVTRNQTTQQTVKPSTEGLSLRFHHHPNDLFANESLTVTVLFNNKPQPGAHLKVTRGGTRYRNERQSLSLVADKQGDVTIQWQGPGLYVIEGEMSQAVKGQAYDRQIHALFTTLEVFPQ